jgi:hypothetical protein
MDFNRGVASAGKQGTEAFWDEDSDSDDYGYDPEVTLESIKISKTINLSISANYTNWAPREAFRELVQNWYAQDLSFISSVCFSLLPSF